MTARSMTVLATILATALCVGPARAQMGPGGPPAVGVTQVTKQEITQRSEFIGRVQAINRVDLTARVTAFIQERSFEEGTEVKQGDLLYKLERAPFEAAVAQQSASVAQANAVLQNATISLGRAQSLLNTPAGQRSTYDDARAQQQSAAAQLAAAQAQLRVANINLDYTEIRAPIDGKIGQTRVTPGNVVSPSSGPLATLVSQDPMYVEFPISARALLDLEKDYADKGGLSGAVVKLRLSDGSTYGPDGKIDFVAPTVATNTDTITVRAEIANPPRHPPTPGQPVDRPLVDGMFVTAVVAGAEPILALGVPRSAVLSDQQGSYVYVVNDKNVAEQRRIQLGQSTATTAIVTAGLQEGNKVVVDGIQRVRPGQPVNPGPAGPAPPGTQGGAPVPSGEKAAATSPANPSPASGSPAAAGGSTRR